MVNKTQEGHNVHFILNNETIDVRGELPPGVNYPQRHESNEGEHFSVTLSFNASSDLSESSLQCNNCYLDDCTIVNSSILILNGMDMYLLMVVIEKFTIVLHKSELPLTFFILYFEHLASDYNY